MCFYIGQFLRVCGKIAFYLEGRSLNSYRRAALDLKRVILNLLRIRKEFGTKAALMRVASSKSIAPSDNGRPQDGERQKKKEVSMLWGILLVLFILWALGFFAFHVGSLIHVLLVIALIVLIVRLLQGRKVL